MKCFFIDENGYKKHFNALKDLLDEKKETQTRLNSRLIEAVTLIIEAKLDDSFISLFVLGLGCGALMYIAASGYMLYAYPSAGSTSSGALFAILPVAAFILCGFEHCIADMFYMFLYGTFDIQRILIITLGNSIGSFIINFLKK